MKKYLPNKTLSIRAIKKCSLRMLMITLKKREKTFSKILTSSEIPCGRSEQNKFWMPNAEMVGYYCGIILRHVVWSSSNRSLAAMSEPL